MAGSWVEIDKDALSHNVGVVRSVIGPSVRLMAVVKSNAYGHGLLECAKVFVDAGVSVFGVDSIEEGALLREFRIDTPILVLNPVDPALVDECAENRLQVMVGVTDWVSAAPATKSLALHLKVDTGMGRQGVSSDSAVKTARAIVKHPHFRLVGVATHCCCADDLASGETAAQKQKFDLVLASLRKADIDCGLVHAASSSATFAFPELHYDMVRVGLALYGMSPFGRKKEDTRTPNTKQLTPALVWKTAIAAVKTVPKGSCVGYGCIERLKGPRTVALLPVGYADGYDRRLSSVGEVIIRGKRARVIGRVSMNLTTVDVTDVVGASAGDEVILLGGGATIAEPIGAEEIAEAMDTINYEVTTRIPAHIPRRFVEL